MEIIQVFSHLNSKAAEEKTWLETRKMKPLPCKGILLLQKINISLTKCGETIHMISRYNLSQKSNYEK
jgi:hypothetical protein